MVGKFLYLFIVPFVLKSYSTRAQLIEQQGLASPIWDCNMNTHFLNFPFIDTSIQVFTRIGTKEEDCNFFLNFFMKSLDSSKYRKDEACLLPYLDLIDSNSENVYNKECYISSRPLEFGYYCRKPEFRYIYLFCLQFIFIERLKLKEGEIVQRIDITKKDLKRSLALTDSDFDCVYSFYKDWIVKAFNNPKKYMKIDPLKYSEYEWEVKIIER